MCCGSADWKREEVPDHKFDFIDVRDYHNTGLWTRTRYGFLFVLVIKSIAVYIADIYTAVTLLAFNKFNGSIYTEVENNPDNTVAVPIKYGKWIFFGCILFSFLLLAYEAHKSRAIIRSRDISYAYTNVMANNYYSLRSYDHFCFFSQINNSTKKKDEIAFFIFFTFKGWKRLVVADGPRQVINGLTLYGLILVSGYSTNVEDYYGGNIITGIMLLTMIFTLVVFTGSAILLIIASIMYLPLLCYMKGNLKEFCCHKIDKRVTELIQLKKKERVAKQAAIARAEAKGDFSHLMNKKGIIVGQKMMQPTLPNVDVDLLLNEKSVPPSSARRQKSHGRMGGGYRPYANGEGDEYGSQANLVLNQGPAGGGHSVHPSTDEYGGAAPSLPPTAHGSPDVYPFHYRGGAGPGPGAGIPASGSVVGLPSEASATGLMAQLGPIGTSPQLFAQRAVGGGSGANGGYFAGAAAGGAAAAAAYNNSRPPYSAGAASTFSNQMHSASSNSMSMSMANIGRQRSQLQHQQSQHSVQAYPYQHQQQQQKPQKPQVERQYTLQQQRGTEEAEVGYGYAYAEEADVDTHYNGNSKKDGGGQSHDRKDTLGGSGAGVDPSSRGMEKLSSGGSTSEAAAAAAAAAIDYMGDLSSYAPYRSHSPQPLSHSLSEHQHHHQGIGGSGRAGYHYSMHEEDVAAIEDVYESYHHQSWVSAGAGGGGGGGASPAPGAGAGAGAGAGVQGYGHGQGHSQAYSQGQFERAAVGGGAAGAFEFDDADGAAHGDRHGHGNGDGDGDAGWDGGDEGPYAYAPAYQVEQTHGHPHSRTQGRGGQQQQQQQQQWDVRQYLQQR